VFVPNLHELVRLLEAPSKDYGLAIELVQNVHDDTVRQRFNAETTQRLHNYLASTMSLVEHSRRIMRKRTGSSANEFESRKASLLSNDEAPFMMDLRVFTQHRTLPWLANTLSGLRPNTADAPWTSEVELSVADLFKWSGWAAQSKRFLTEQGDAVLLRPVVRKHGELMYELNSWLYSALAAENAEALEEVNRLVVERNAVLLGAGFEEAKKWTEARMRERSQPGPDYTPLSTLSRSDIPGAP
jgi:hypothetical protein